MEKQKAAHPRALYWQRVQSFTLILLAVWAVPTFVVIFFARELSGFTLFGWPFSFYMAAQGLTILYVLIVLVYLKRMRRLDNILKTETSDAR